MRDIDLREIDLKKLRLSKRTWVLLATALVVIGGGALAWHHINHPPKPWLVRWRLNRYLAKEAHTGDFKVDFPFPSKAEMAKRSDSEPDRGPLRGSRTGKDFDTLRDEYLTEKTAELALARDIARGETRLTDRKSRLERLTRRSGGGATNGEDNPSSLVESNITALRAEIANLEKTVARRPEVEAKETALAPMVDDLWEFQRAFAVETSGSASGSAAALAKARAQLVAGTTKKLNEASSYEAMYHAIGQELFVAKRLLESGNREHRREGVSIALTAARAPR